MIDLMDSLNVWAPEIAGTITSLGVVIVFIRRIVKRMKPMFEILESVRELTKAVNEIKSEFKTNGGSTMKDAINALKSDVTQNTSITNRILNRQTWGFNNQDDPLFETDTGGQFVWCNTAYCELAGRPMLDLLGFRWKNIISENHREHIVDSWEKAILEKRSFESKIFITSKTGVHHEAYCVATICQDGRYLGILLDVMEVRK